MSAFEVVTIVVAAVAVVIAVSAYLGVLRQLGRRGQTWFERPDDRPLEERPSEDEPDAPLPKRPLRGRPW